MRFALEFLLWIAPGAALVATVLAFPYMVR